jgi:hypothetical protein
VLIVSPSLILLRNTLKGRNWFQLFDVIYCYRGRRVFHAGAKDEKYRRFQKDGRDNPLIQNVFLAPRFGPDPHL